MVEILPEMKLAEIHRVFGETLLQIGQWTIVRFGKKERLFKADCTDVISYLTIIMKLRCGGPLMTFLFLGIVRWRTVLSLISSVCLCSEAYIDVWNLGYDVQSIDGEFVFEKMYFFET